MKIGLLFGFMYDYDKNNKIPGILIDLYLTYKFLNDLNYDKIIIITDIDNKIKINDIKLAILKGLIYDDVLTFLDDISNKKLLYKFNNINDMNNFIVKNIIDCKFLYLYYTGHSINNTLILDINNSINTIDLLKIILSKVDRKCQILFIFDCCYGSNFNLPFNINTNGICKLNNLENPYFIKYDIVCIISSKNYEKSYSTIIGSPFTKAFIDNIKKDNIKNWSELAIKMQYDINNIINKKQNIQIYTSNIQKYIWIWVNTKYKYKLSYDYLYNYLIIN